MIKASKVNALVIGQAISQFGSSMTNLALIMWLKKEHESGSILGLYFFVATITVTITSIFVGEIVDRHKKHKVLIASDLLSTGIMALAAILFLGISSAKIILVSIFTVKIFLSILYSVRQPLVGSIVTDFVPQNRYAKVNSLIFSSTNIAMVIAEFITGFLFIKVGIGLIAWADSITYFFAAAFLYFAFYGLTKPNNEESASKQAGFWANTKEGWQYIYSRPGLMPLVLCVFLVKLFFSPYVILTPFLVENTLNLSAEWFGYFTAAMSAGMFLGSFLAWLPGFNDAKTNLLIFFLLTIGILFIFIGINPFHWISLALYGLLGLATGGVNIKIVSIIQRYINSQYLGRTFAGISMVTSIADPISKAFTGVLVDIANKDVRFIFIIFGAIILLISLLQLFMRKIDLFFNDNIDISTRPNGP